MKLTENHKMKSLKDILIKVEFELQQEGIIFEDLQFQNSIKEGTYDELEEFYRTDTE